MHRDVATGLLLRGVKTCFTVSLMNDANGSTCDVGQ